MGVYIQGENWATQGPAPDGFHVPLKNEWVAVYNIWTALGGGSSDGTNFGIALKLPFAGNRHYSSAGVSYQGTNGIYWSSSRSNDSNAYSLYFNSTALTPQNNGRRAFGFSVRCFNNSPVVPTSNWTKLYGTSIESGGIFWSSADGLISLSSDGTTWITIADKNLGATTVWNSGDILSEDNCGKYYQWGNNYCFPRTGTIANQSTTQVDASNYGPGNYYSSDTFIKYNGRWDTTDNGNLWGGVDGNVLTMSELKNAYIGQGIWKPGSNTVAYYPLTSDVNDAKTSGTKYNLTNNGITFTTVGGVACASMTSNVYATSTAIPLPSGSNARTLSFWFRNNGITNDTYFMGYGSHSTGYFFAPRINNGKYSFMGYSRDFDTGTSATTGAWQLHTITYNGSTVTYYLNGNQIGSGNYSLNTTAVGSTWKYIIGCRLNSSANPGNYINGYMSNVVLENKCWTATEVLDYYNLTKGNY